MPSVEDQIRTQIRKRDDRSARQRVGFAAGR
jgi:hypothetical protein